MDQFAAFQHMVNMVNILGELITDKCTDMFVSAICSCRASGCISQHHFMPIKSRAGLMFHTSLNESRGFLGQAYSAMVWFCLEMKMFLAFSSRQGFIVPKKDFTVNLCLKLTL